MSIVQQLNKLKTLKTKGTCLISCFIPQNTQLSLTKQHLIKEISESCNIKSRQTKSSVQKALRSALQLIDKTKKNISPGLVIYTGNATCASGNELFI